MEANETFTFSQAEARKMRVGAFLPLLLILPIAASFGLDSSKSQPSHFLITFGIGIAFAVVFVSMSRAGVQGRIEQLANTTLSVTNRNLVWQFAAGRTELAWDSIFEVIINERMGVVKSIVLKLNDGGQSKIEGFDRMDVLVSCLQEYLGSHRFITKKWLHV